MIPIRLTWITMATALALLLSLPGIGQSQDGTGGLPDIDKVLELPPYDGPRADCIASALAHYEKGDVARAWSEARTITRRQMTRAEDKAAAQALVDFIDKLGERVMAAADRFIEAERFLLAAELLDKAGDLFGRHEVGSDARKKLRDLKKAHEDRLDAQQTLAEIEQLLAENEPDRAKSRFARLEGRHPDLPETTAARNRINGFDPVEAERRLALQYAFGTVTATEKTPGRLDCKGSCSRLVQGGYMKFDLSEYPAGTTFKSGTLKVFVEKWSGNHWRWLTHIPSDPTDTDAATTFREIQAQSAKFSGVITLREPNGWLTVRLNQAAINAINQALANADADKRWIAIAFGFE